MLYRISNLLKTDNSHLLLFREHLMVHSWMKIFFLFLLHLEISNQTFLKTQLIRLLLFTWWTTSRDFLVTEKISLVILFLMQLLSSNHLLHLWNKKEVISSSHHVTMNQPLTRILQRYAQEDHHGLPMLRRSKVETFHGTK